MENKHAKIIEAVEDFYYLTSNALQSRDETLKEIHEAEESKQYDIYRERIRDLKANEEYRNNLVEVLYGKLKEFYSPSSSTE